MLIDEILQGPCDVYEGYEKDLQENQKDEEDGSEKGKRVKKRGKWANQEREEKGSKKPKEKDGKIQLKVKVIKSRDRGEIRIV